VAFAFPITPCGPTGLVLPCTDSTPAPGHCKPVLCLPALPCGANMPAAMAETATPRGAPGLTRRRLLKLMGAGLAAVGACATCGACDALYLEPGWIRLERLEVRLRGLPRRLDGFRIVQLSDLHRSSDVSVDHISQAVELALQEHPDVVAMTGDFVTGSAEYASSCAAALQPLAKGGRAFACLGNHDHWTDADVVERAISAVGITVLRNDARELADGLWLAAVDDVWEQQADLHRALRSAPTGAGLVLLAHEPDYADVVAADGRVGLQLSGHSHGGQVRLPLLGALVVPYLAEKYDCGLYELPGLTLYVNRGVGLIQPTVRFNCSPEVALITLRAGVS
jgi:predicted MPP superfamily phosphohydrolase